MRNNVKLRVLFILAIALLLLITFSTNVNAVTDTEIETILNEMPSSMELDIKEIEYKKAEDIIHTNIANKLTEAGFPDIKISVNILDYLDYNDFYKAEIYLYRDNQQIAQKQISLTYSNSNDRNSTDEQYVKTIELESPQYYEVDLFDLHKEGFDVLGMAKPYYQNQVKDNSITILTSAGSYGGEPLTYWTHGTSVLFFKNDILYDLRHMGSEFTIPVITVPSNIENIEEFAINQLNLFLENTDNGDLKITTLKKGADIEIDIPDIYSIDGGWYVIIRQEQEQEPVTKTDNTTGIKLDTDTDIVPAETALVVKKLTAGTTYNTILASLGSDVSKFELYDISLVNNNAAIQPNGKVKISIPIPSGYDKTNLVVFRFEDNGNKVEYKVSVVTINNVEYAQFETDHFSNYLLAEKSVEEQPVPTPTPTPETPAEDNSNRVLDDEPKTGIIDIKFIIGIILVISVIATVRKQNKNG